MSITEAQIRQLGKLSRISLSDKEIHDLKADLNKIVSYVNELSQVDVSCVSPMVHVGNFSLRFREDETKTVVGRKGLLGSEGYEEGLIKVPKVVE